MGCRNPVGDAVSQVQKKLPVRGQGTPYFWATQFTVPAPGSWGTWFCLIPGKNLPNVFPVYEQPMLYCFLSGVLAVDSFSSWPSMGVTCFPRHFSLLVRASKICFPTQGQQGHLENLLCGRVTHCCSQVAWGCDTQDSPHPPLPSLELSTTAGEWPLFHGGSKHDEIGRRTILEEAAGVSCRQFHL